MILRGTILFDKKLKKLEQESFRVKEISIRVENKKNKKR